jgi:hypothetical protein
MASPEAEAQKRWAAGRLGIKASQIRDVSWEIDDLGPGCETCGDGGGIDSYARISLVKGDEKIINFSRYEMGSIIGEVCAMMQEF